MEELKLKALCEYFNCEEEEIEVMDYSDSAFEYDGGEYKILTDEEADEEEKEQLECYLEDIIYSEIPEWAKPYFNEGEWIKDNSGYDRGGHIAYYDGNEIEITTVNEETGETEYFYLYRTN